MVKPITRLQAQGRQGRVASWASFDPFMVITTLVLIGFGLITIWSGEGAGPLTLSSLVVQQGLFVVIGVPLMLALTMLDYRYVQTFSWIIYAGSLVLLLIVMVAGTTTGGSSRWIDIGPFTLQPSEIAKLCVIIALAAFITNRGDEMRHLTNFLLSGVIVAIPALIVFQQPDLGSASAFGFVWLVMLLMSATRMIYLIAVAVASIPVGLLAWEFVLYDYMRERLLISL
jgi:rod shape determining protein RodA